jgi:hypothetical protein
MAMPDTMLHEIRVCFMSCFMPQLDTHVRRRDVRDHVHVRMDTYGMTYGCRHAVTEHDMEMDVTETLNLIVSKLDYSKPKAKPRQNAQSWSQTLIRSSDDS